MNRNYSFTVGILILAVGVLFGAFGYLRLHPDGGKIDFILEDFYASVSAELIGIAITVLIIDSLYSRSARSLEIKNQFISDLRSPDKKHVERTVEELRKRKWLTNGSLRKAYLCGANLSHLDLRGCDFGGAFLSGVNFSNSKMQYCILDSADMKSVDFQNTDLSNSSIRWADLSCSLVSNADFTNTELTGTLIGRDSVSQVRSFSHATMPNGQLFEKWDNDER